MRRSAWITILGAVAAQAAVVSTAQAGPSDAVLVGVVRDASTGEGIEGALVIVTGEKIQGERTMTTNVSGLYRIPNLPPGTYDVTVFAKDYGAGNKRTGLQLRAGVTIRVDVSLVRSGAREVIEVSVPAPTVDVGSSATGLSVDREMAQRVPIAIPTGKGAANRSFEAIAEATPGARNDTYGTSIAGTTSPENKYYVDGLSVNDPGFGLNGTGLSMEFLEEVRIEAGGYMPEHGRSTGGVINAVTKSGSNQFHGNVWAYYTPGQLEGRREIARREGDAIVTERNLNWIGDAGFDLGGRLIKDKLWFYGGVSIARTVYDLTSSWNRVALDPGGNALIDPETKFTVTERIAGTTQRFKAQGTTVQAIGKLTYSPNKRNTLELLAIYAPSLSGGNGTFGMNAQTGQPEVLNLVGDYGALARKYRDNSTDLQFKWNWRDDEGKWNFDTILGWHHQLNQRNAVDGSRVGDTTGLAGTPSVVYRQTNNFYGADGSLLEPGMPGYREVHSLTDLTPMPSGAPAGACDPMMYGYTDPTTMDAQTRSVICPIRQWTSGGPGLLYDRRLDRLQAREIVTRLARGAGHHVIKFGVDFEYTQYNSNRGYSGNQIYRESTNGTNFADFRMYSFLSGPDDANVIRNLNWNVMSTTIGGFIQDSWSIMDKVTLNAGLRYDAQHLFSGDRSLAMALPNQFSPRVGLIWDPTYSGKAKLFVNYARFYQSVPLNLADRAGTGEPGLQSFHNAVGPGACNDPLAPGANEPGGACTTDANRIPIGGPADPDQRWALASAGKTPIDPRLKPQSSDEIVAGGEYEIITDTRLGVQYTHRWLHRAIEDMSRDEAATYFIGNPGYGVAKDFPKAKRVYDAATLFIEKRFAKHWMITGSYTLSWLRGNLAGLFRPETGQLDPNTTSDFDLISLLENRSGYLPGDTRHSFKIFAAGEIVLGNGQFLRLGGAFRARSGGPTNFLASHVLYGFDESFILPRGTGERLPWNFSIDPTIGYTKILRKDLRLTISMDVFNVANFQQILAIDERYTFDEVNPIKGGTSADLANATTTGGTPITVNPNFGNPTLYQQPRQFRFGVRLSF
nr:MULTISPECIES: TonB-dependent receptor [unclassified Nannocystis]